MFCIDNEYDKPNEVLKLLIESWEDFKKYYKTEKDRYSKDKLQGHVVCWKEDDIVLQLSRFFYNKLSTSKLKDEKGIEIHSQTQISKGKFPEDAYAFSKKIGNLKGKPRPDFIITKEDDRNCSEVNGSLWLIGEVKYFREFHSNWRDLNDKDQPDRIQKDLDKLSQFKEFDICKKTVYLVADDFFHKPENKKIGEWDNIKAKLKESKLKQTGNKVDYIDLITMCSKIDCSDCNGFNFKEYCKT